MAGPITAFDTGNFVVVGAMDYISRRTPKKAQSNLQQMEQHTKYNHTKWRGVGGAGAAIERHCLVECLFL